MNIQILSDLHFEFHADHGRSFVDALDPTGVDVLVVAGDLASGGYLEGALALLARRFARVVFVTGNHELYTSSPRAVAKVRARVLRDHPNVHWLEHESVMIDGVRFVGTPLWFADTPIARRYQHQINDFAYIADFVPWVYEENARALRFLSDTVKAGDVVVTHHLPSFSSVHPRYAGSPLNAYFVCDVEPLIAERKPLLWVHGHTHESCDYRLADTRIVCNPLGYAKFDLNFRFDDRFQIEISAEFEKIA